MQKKFLIFSPINEYGGVNLDVAFLADIIEKKHQVKVISLGNFYPNSSVYLFNPSLEYDSLNRMIFNDHSLIRWLTKWVSHNKPRPVPAHFRVENKATRSLLINVEAVMEARLKKEIETVDVIVLCSQLTSRFMQEIIELAASAQKRILFRTTGQIWPRHLKDGNDKWFNKVDVFMHHSARNRDALFNYTRFDNHQIVDQNAYFEDRFLKLPIPNGPIRRFFALSRLHKAKNISALIEAFQQLNHPDCELHIYGDGPEEKTLKQRAKKHPKIYFHGPVGYNEVPGVFAENDCLVISSSYEAGPYTVVESMAAATPMISTRVGAMEQRLETYPYFYDGTSQGLLSQLKAMTSLTSEAVAELGQSLRARYRSHHSEAVIRSQYEAILFA